MSISTKVQPLDTEDVDGGEVERYEIRHDEQLVMMLDFFDGEFSVEWFTPHMPPDFIHNLKRTTGVGNDVQTMAMFSPPDGGPDKTVQGPLSSVMESEEFPDHCTFLQVEPEGTEVEFAWTRDTPTATMIISGSIDEFNIAEKLFRITAEERDLSSQESESVLEKARECLNQSQNARNRPTSKFLRSLFGR
ncbi:hypothetical protein GCM10009037_16950 [Halarchaeum grantii]|uniref:Uncharacterized protein n=2 Tax=Halarchaeum grantii TaxID=1193105 RepID=A0A830EV83_9EURY|nr:hypothetical protein GCM10009037_16950 [Halarchaeum grantii]